MKKIKFWYGRFKEKRMIKRCIKEADYQKMITGRQHFVIPVDDGTFRIINSDGIKNYNKIKGTPKLTYVDFCRIAIYRTK